MIYLDLGILLAGALVALALLYPSLFPSLINQALSRIPGRSWEAQHGVAGPLDVTRLNMDNNTIAYFDRLTSMTEEEN